MWLRTGQEYQLVWEHIDQLMKIQQKFGECSLTSKSGALGWELQYSRALRNMRVVLDLLL